MKEKYVNLTITVTEFDTEDVITTSDTNNAFVPQTDLTGDGGKPVPVKPW